MITDKQIEDKSNEAENELYAYNLGRAFGLLSIKINALARAMGTGLSSALQEEAEATQFTTRERIGLWIIRFGSWVGGFEDA